MFREQTYEVIRKRVLDNIINDIDKREGSVTSNLISPLSEEVARAYLAISEILGVGFIEDTFNEYLEKRTSEFGVYRKAGKNATGIIEIEGREKAKIPAETIIYAYGLGYKVLDEIVLGSTGVATASVIAENIGYKYNLEKDTEFTALERLEGITCIKAEEAFTNGVDTETDDELRDRFRVFINNPRTSGNIYHYQEWALECEGIGKAKVYPLWNGDGTVKVMVTGNNNRPVDSELLEKCRLYIESQRPIGATVALTTPTLLNIDTNIKFELNHDYTLNEVEDEIKVLVTDYIESCDTEITFAKVFGYVANLSGVNDILEFKLNNAKSNISIAEDKIPVMQSITITGVLIDE